MFFTASFGFASAVAVVAVFDEKDDADDDHDAAEDDRDERQDEDGQIALRLDVDQHDGGDTASESDDRKSPPPIVDVPTWK